MRNGGACPPVYAPDYNETLCQGHGDPGAIGLVSVMVLLTLLALALQSLSAYLLGVDGGGGNDD